MDRIFPGYVRCFLLQTDRTLLKSSPFSAQNNDFYGIDLAKFICAFLVCMIHITPFPVRFFPFIGKINFLLKHCYARIAVPFYFAATGFLLFRRTDPRHFEFSSVKSYCIKILRLLGMWHVLLFIGKTFHLWYLGATVIAVLLLSFCFKKGFRARYIALLAAGLFLIGLLGTSYSFVAKPLSGNPLLRLITSLYTRVFHTTRNGVFMGFIFVCIGALLAHKTIRIPMGLAVCGFLLSLIMMGTEVFVLSRYASASDYNMFLSLIPAVFFFLYIAVNIKLKRRNIYKKLRVYSSLIYFIHLFVFALVKTAISVIRQRFGIDLLSFTFILDVLLSLGFSALLLFLSEKKHLRWLRWLYS